MSSKNSNLPEDKKGLSPSPSTTTVLPMLENIMNYHDKNKEMPPTIDYTTIYGPSPSSPPSEKDKKSEIKSQQEQYEGQDVMPTPNKAVPFQRVISAKYTKEQILQLTCNNKHCRLYPLYPLYCPDCNLVFCKTCVNGERCLKCNSNLSELQNELSEIYNENVIECKYKEVGCEERKSPGELENHEPSCAQAMTKCKDCNGDYTHEEMLSHRFECKNRKENKCPTCNYEDEESEFKKTEMKIKHMKHILMDEMQTLIRQEFQKLTVIIETTIKNSVEEATSGLHKKMNMPEIERKIDDLLTGTTVIQSTLGIGQGNENEKKLLPYQQELLLQKLKSISLVNTLITDIDNGYETDNKFCYVNTFDKKFLVLYPTDRYGVSEYNLSNNKITNQLKSPHQSNIITMTSIPHITKKETYLITASFDRSIKVFSIEQQYTQVKEYQNAHDDYSLYALDAMYDETKGVVVISGCYNLQEIKLWYVDLNEDNGKEKMHIKVNGKVCCVKCKNNTIYVGSTQGVFMYLMEGIDKEGKANKQFVDENAVAPKKGELKHTAITFMDGNDKWMVEADSMGVVRVWDIESGKMEKVIKREMNEFQINSLSTWDNVYIIAGARDGKVVLYDVEQGECVDSVGEHKGYVYCVKVIKHWKYNKSILSCGYDGQVKFWGSIK